MDPEKSTIRVAVIGSGAAGLCCGRHLINEPDQFVFDIFEQQDGVGGTWRYSDNVGVDEYGLPVHSSMYKNLKTNLPKEVMAFPDFPFQPYDGQSFIHHTLVLQYLQDYAQHYGLHKHIKFQKLVQNVRPLKHSNGKVEWAVSYTDVVSKEKETKLYDSVMVCNGHYSVPYIPKLQGLEDFQGILMHSHNYRDNEQFKNLKVVVLGAGASGVDIALEISDVAKKVVLSHNTPFKKCPLPGNMQQEKGIQHVNKSSVTFLDGKTETCDAIILCTGYLYEYTFFDSTCKVEIGDQRVSPLYLHTFLIDFPTLAIWAVPKLIVPFPIYDQQAKIFLKFLKGLIKLPIQIEMRKAEEEDFARRLESGFKPRHAHVMPKEWQWEFDDALSKLGEIDPIPDAIRNLFRHVHRIRTVDLINYKKTKYRLLDDKSFSEIN